MGQEPGGEGGHLTKQRQKQDTDEGRGGDGVAVLVKSRRPELSRKELFRVLGVVENAFPWQKRCAEKENEKKKCLPLAKKVCRKRK